GLLSDCLSVVWEKNGYRSLDAGNEPADQLGELAPVERLAEAIVAADLQALQTIVVGRVRTQGQDWTGVPTTSELPGRLKTVNDRHLQVHEDQVERISRGVRSQGQVGSVTAVRDPDHFQAQIAKLLREDLQQIAIVLGQQDARMHGLR